MLTRFGVICLYVQDFPRMLSFYRDTLHLPPGRIHPGEDHKLETEWTRFELQGTALELFALSRAPKRLARLPSPRENATLLCFIVDDFEAQYQALLDSGVSMQPRREAEWGRYAHFRDPEGNELQIYQPNPGY